MDEAKEAVAEMLAKQASINMGKQDILNSLEIPPSPELGDYAFPCFALAKQMKSSPAGIATELAMNISAANNKNKKNKEISGVKAAGPYLNFFIDKKLMAESTINKILKEKEKFGRSKEGKGRNVVIDMSSPNIAKPFGIGHLRSTIIGNSLANIFSHMGFKAIRMNYLGDWGTQFGRMIVGFKRFGSRKELAKSPIKHMLDIYVKASDEKYEQEAREWFKRLEQGDKEALKLWKSFRDMSIKDFDKIYRILGIKFDVISGESLYNDKLGAVIKQLKEKNLLKESEGAMVVDLEEYGLGVCLIQKSDQASLYATRDLAAAIDRHEKYRFAKMIYEVGAEQKLHFKQVFKVLELMGYSWSKGCVHVEHGFYLDKDGKKFATRKGKLVFMEDILQETIALAKKTISEKNPGLRGKDEVARKVAVGAIFYGDLKNNRAHDIVFDIERFLDFEGDTGPYLQYSYARASSILKKMNVKKGIKDISIKHTPEFHETELVKKLNQFPGVAENAYRQLNPSLIANYAFQLAQSFNEFYHACPVMHAEKNLQKQRIGLVQAFLIVMKQALRLLGIEAIEEM